MNGTTVNHGAVSDRYFTSDLGRPGLIHHMYAGVILDIGSITDFNPVDIAPYRYIKPDAAFFTDSYITDNIRTRCYKYAVIEMRTFPQKFINHANSILSYKHQLES